MKLIVSINIHYTCSKRRLTCFSWTLVIDVCCGSDHFFILLSRRQDNNSIHYAINSIQKQTFHWERAGPFPDRWSSIFPYKQPGVNNQRGRRCVGNKSLIVTRALEGSVVLVLATVICGSTPENSENVNTLFGYGFRRRWRPGVWWMGPLRL